MPRFASNDGVEIAYQEWAPGSAEATSTAHLPPVVLHHGFIADANLNWVAPAVVEALVRAGRRVVALDARGHGASGKPHDPAFYGEDKMAADLRRLFDLIGVTESHEVDLVGYSMGAVVSLLTASQDARVRRLVVGGVGGGLVEQAGLSARAAARGTIAAALRASEAASIHDPIAGRFRALADRVTGADREALAACAENSFSSSIPFDQITAPTLVLVGAEDPLAARAEALAAAIPGAQLRVITGDHLTAVTNPAFAPAIVTFLGVA